MGKNKKVITIIGIMILLLSISLTAYADTYSTIVPNLKIKENYDILENSVIEYGYKGGKLIFEGTGTLGTPNNTYIENIRKRESTPYNTSKNYNSIIYPSSYYTGIDIEGTLRVNYILRRTGYGDTGKETVRLETKGVTLDFQPIENFDYIKISVKDFMYNNNMEIKIKGWRNVISEDMIEVTCRYHDIGKSEVGNSTIVTKETKDISIEKTGLIATIKPNVTNAKSDIQSIEEIEVKIKKEYTKDVEYIAITEESKYNDYQTFEPDWDYEQPKLKEIFVNDIADIIKEKQYEESSLLDIFFGTVNNVFTYEVFDTISLGTLLMIAVSAFVVMWVVKLLLGG